MHGAILRKKEMEQIKTARKQRRSVTVLNSISLLSPFFFFFRALATSALLEQIIYCQTHLSLPLVTEGKTGEKHREALRRLPAFHSAPCWKLVPRNVTSLIYLYRACAAGAGAALQCGDGDGSGGRGGKICEGRGSAAEMGLRAGDNAAAF